MVIIIALTVTNKTNSNPKGSRRQQSGNKTEVYKIRNVVKKVG